MPRRALKPVSDGYAEIQTANFWRFAGDERAERDALVRALACVIDVKNDAGAAQLRAQLHQRLKQREEW